MTRRGLLCLLVLAACGDDDGVVPIDATPMHDVAPAVTDASPLPDRVDPLLWVDFSATGCETGGVDDEPCAGRAPLELRFAASAPADIDTFVWTFGDGSPPDSSPTPLHHFERPGTYDVLLTVGGPGGTATAARMAFVVVEAARVGDACDLDVQCAGDLECVCGDDADCPAGLASGSCSTACNATDVCPDSGVCVDLTVGDPPVPADWNRVMCARECVDDSECRDGMRCQELRNGAGGGWVKGCFPAGLLAAVGQACAAPDGDLDDAACTSGVCADEGARGMCTLDCATTPCPTYAACATFNDGALGLRCLARCTDELACDSDPWLACAAPGGDGAKGFTVGEAPSAGGYCAPKACVDVGDCGADGDCIDGFCAAG